MAIIAFVIVVSATAAKGSAHDVSLAPGLLAHRVEVPSLRSEHSRTFKTPDGTFEVIAGATPLNFRAPDGTWRPINNNLRVQADGTFANTANSFSVEIPGTADAPVSVSSGGRTLAFTLVGADRSTAAVDKATAHFDSVASNVDLAYEVKSRALKETLTLTSSDAPSVYRYEVRTPGLRAVLTDAGEVVFKDATGRNRFRFASPWMQDADGAYSRDLAYHVRETGRETAVELRISRAWLDAQGRTYPVTVDPTVYEGALGVCELVSGSSARVSGCTTGGPALVGRDANGQIHRIAGYVPVPDVPYGAVVMGAELAFELSGQSAREGSTLDLFALTTHLGPGATWNLADSNTPWTTPGGDTKAVRESRRTLRSTAVGTLTGLGLSELAQGWVDETEENLGVLVKSADESIEHIDALDDVQIKVRYQRRMGLDDSAYTYDPIELSDGTTINVNLGSGNLVVTADDFGLGGFDEQLSLNRFYNSKDDADEQGLFGLDWRGDFGTITLETNPVDGSVEFNGPTGKNGLFVHRSDGTFKPPLGTDATLTENPDGSATLEFHDTAETWEFDSSTPRRRLLSHRYASGEGEAGTYDSAGRPATIRDADGNTATFRYDSTGLMRTATDQFGDIRHYDYDGSGRLVRFEDATGAITSYVYNRAGLLERIQVPDRSGVYITYYSEQAVETVTPFDADDNPGPTRAYTGGPGHAELIVPGEKVETHYFNRQLFNYESEVGANGPTTGLSGALYDARGTALPVGAYDLGYSISDADGIESGTLVVDGGESESLDIDCETSCPTALTGRWSLDTDDYDAGPHAIRLEVTDQNGNEVHKAFRVTLPGSSWTSDGVLDGDGQPDPYEGADWTTAPCEGVFGAGALLCNSDGTGVEDAGVDDSHSALSISAKVALKAHDVVYGLAQDWGKNADLGMEARDWITSPKAQLLTPKTYRRILSFNMLETRGGGRFNGDASTLKDAKAFNDFKDQYDAVYGRDGVGGEIIVSFGHSTEPGIDLPTDNRYKNLVLSFFATFPKVRIISAWNEPNHKDQPTHRPLRHERALRALHGGAPRAAKYTYLATQACKIWTRRRLAAGKPNPRCKILAGEFAQAGVGRRAAWVTYMETYIKALERLMPRGEFPTLWAFHPYTDVKLDTPREQKHGYRDKGRYVPGTMQFVRRIPRASTLWFTEVGSRVDKGGSGGRLLPRRLNTLEGQRAEVQYLYRQLAQVDPSIKRVLYYSPFGDIIWDRSFLWRWDTSLTGDITTYPYGGLNDRERGSYCVALRYMNPGVASSRLPAVCR